MSTSRRPSPGLLAALAAGGLLLAVPAAGSGTPPTALVSAAAAWPQAQRGTVQPKLADGTEYRPGIFLDARTSVGTAETPDGRFLRLVLLGADDSVRELRRLPRQGHPSFQTFAVAGDDLVWVEGRAGGPPALWAAGLRGGPARLLCGDVGRATFYQSQYDLVVDGGRVYWAAAGAADTTEVRSVALTGGPVQSRPQAGTWKLSAFPWLVDGVNQAAGATRLRDLTTGREVAVARAGERATTACGPVWCRVAALAEDGTNRIELMHPDGSGHARIAGDSASTVITDVAPLDRFEVLAQLGPNSELTGNNQLVAYELATRQTVEISPDAGSVSYRYGVLWWTTGNLDGVVWHSLDLRSI
ncbi:hypothetical protein ACFQFC_05990 [Amorphoplanes digitatis]|uniref:Uncharacterized protein n=1 Tax=Actinoplanes digitatis TaxID=1868 RepID=A0A7W7MRM0_9ACTN|nr:hypothetical protein [Actinoplanes digitatis]MBB4763745.1 hypothetical protein [Actinoplanes digitatis]GID92997.1 hypothetical protein Adi01nite_24090 [Actinoplanes digitatis]